MDVHPYYGPGNIVIDTCSRCNVIWLDCGELQQIADAPGKDRGRRFAAEPKIAEPLSDARGRSGGARTYTSIELVGLLADLFSSD